MAAGGETLSAAGAHSIRSDQGDVGMAALAPAKVGGVPSVS